MRHRFHGLRAGAASWAVRLVVALAAAAAAGGLIAAQPWLAPARAQDGPAVVRFHVVAHSDGEADQAIKRAVRDELVAYLQRSRPWEGAGSPEQALERIARHRGALERLSRQTLRRLHAPYDVQVQVGRHAYDTRTYRGLTLPAGAYPSVRVILGAGRGANWWCVLYPTFCTVEPVARTDLTGRVATLQADEAVLLLQQSPPEVRLALLDWLRRWPALAAWVDALQATLAAEHEETSLAR